MVNGNETVYLDFTFFFWALIIIGTIGIFSAVYKNSIDKVIKEVDEKSNGHSL